MVGMPSVVSAEEWQKERDDLLLAEKEATRRLDAIAAQRRRLPMVRFDNERYLFETTDGPKRLSDFFEGSQQLAVYQFMDNGPDAFCPGCTHFTANVTDLADAGRRGGQLADGVEHASGPDGVLLGPKGLGRALRFLARNPRSPTTAGPPRVSCSTCSSPTAIRCTAPTATNGRGVDRLLFVNNILDLAPYGRQEEWEDSPPAGPSTPPTAELPDDQGFGLVSKEETVWCLPSRPAVLARSWPSPSTSTPGPIW